MYRTRQQDKETKQINIFLLVIGMLGMSIAINHTIYEKGQYMVTWLFVVIPYTLALLNRPNYRSSCGKAIGYACVMVAPYIGLAIVMVTLVSFFTWVLGK